MGATKGTAIKGTICNCLLYTLKAGSERKWIIAHLALGTRVKWHCCSTPPMPAICQCVSALAPNIAAAPRANCPDQCVIGIVQHHSHGV